jgi:tetratricopeptide (TPR) repeat protein
VRPLVDFVAISDTGSTDETQEIIRGWLKANKVDGFVCTDRWTGFAHNRNKALEALSLYPKVDYAFVIDADDTLEIAPAFDVAAFKAAMTFDIYDLMVHHAGVIHPRPQIFRNKPGYHWVGVLHEYLDAPEGFTRALEPSLIIHASIEGSRNADPKKFHKDAEILKKALKTEKNGFLRARYTFYLAQSYRDAEDPAKALKYYLNRSKMGFYDQEVYIALLEAIRAYTKIGKVQARHDGPFDCFEQAIKIMPNRVEADHAYAFLCRQVGANKDGMEAARRGLDLSAPGGLFIQPWIYDYGLRDEFAVNAYWAGQYRESLESSLKLLASDKTPADMVKRLAINSLAALEKLNTPPPAPEPMFLFSD